MTNKRGIGLIELLISLAIFLMVVGLVFSITGTGRISWSTASGRLHLSAQARLASAIISNDLSLASSSRIFIQNNGTEIRFSVPVIDANGALNLIQTGDIAWGDGEIAGNSLRYILSLGRLLRQTLDASGTLINEKVIAQDVSSFTVSLNGSLYEFTLGFSLNSWQGTLLPTPLNYAITIAITPRN